MAKNLDIVTYKGIRFYRLPDSKKSSFRNYYQPAEIDIYNGVQRLHIEIWKDAHGPVPPGHHIHHIDGNPLNNDISNLTCLPRLEHLRLHGATKKNKAASRKNIKKAIEAAPAWHRSPEGRAWHREHALRVAAAQKPVVRVCEQCGKSYETLKKGLTRFCSNNCKSIWRYRAGIDNITKPCDICGSDFTSNRYQKARMCLSCRGRTGQAARYAK